MWHAQKRSASAQINVNESLGLNLESLQAGENEISLRKWSGGTAQLRILEGALIVLV